MLTHIQQSWFCKQKLHTEFWEQLLYMWHGPGNSPSLSSATYYGTDASHLLPISFPWEVLDPHSQALECTSLHNNLLSWVTIFFSLWICGQLLKLWVVLSGSLTDFVWRSAKGLHLISVYIHVGRLQTRDWRRNMSLFYFMINKQALTQRIWGFGGFWP